MRKVFTNMFQNRLEHRRQMVRSTHDWLFAPGLRWTLWCQRQRSIKRKARA